MFFDKGIIVTVCLGSLLATRLIDDIKILKTPEQLDAGIVAVIDVNDDIFMKTMDEVLQLYVDARRTSPSAENLDRLKANLEKLKIFGRYTRFALVLTGPQPVVLLLHQYLHKFIVFSFVLMN